MICLLAMVTGISNAQIVVNIKPARPTVVVTRPAAPGPGYIWVDDDWSVQGKQYVWKGGYWSAAPKNGAKFNKGYWKRNKKGWHWVPGRWK